MKKLRNKPGCGTVRKIHLFGMALLCACILTAADECGSVTAGQEAGSSGAGFMQQIAGKEWKLIELRLSDAIVMLDRDRLSPGMSDIFTMSIDNERISGRGSPNRYFSSYRVEANNALTINAVASTLMAAINTEAPHIQEQDFFRYLERVQRWAVNGNRLELYSSDARGRALVMVFVD